MSQQEGLEILCQSISKRYTIREKKPVASLALW